MTQRASLRPEVVAFLAREGKCTVAPHDPGYFQQDVAGYEIVERKDTPFGQFRPWIVEYEPRRDLTGADGCTSLDTPYINRLSGLSRLDTCDPDSLGRALSANGLLWVDNPGEGIAESLLICRKYGLFPTFTLPGYGLPLAYTEDELRRMDDWYAREMEYMVRWLRQLAPLLGRDPTTDERQIWIHQGPLYDDNPFMVFLEKAALRLNVLEAEFQERYGFPLPLSSTGSDPISEARRIRFWWWIRHKYAMNMAKRASIARRYLAGKLVGNIEFDMLVNYREWGEIFDIPGVNLRPLLLDHEWARPYWVGYGTRLASDLMGKPVLVSVRTNVSGAGPRAIATPDTIRMLHSEAVQNGAIGFYHWMHDFAGDRQGAMAYSGPCIANPDRSTLPELRWRTHLEIARKLSSTRVFQPPSADVGVFVGTEAAVIGDGWKRIFSAYIELRRAGIWHRFVSDEQVLAGGTDLGQFRVVVVPTLRYADRRVREALLDYAKKGGVLVCCSGDCFAYDSEGLAADDWRKEALGVERVRVSEQYAHVRVDFGGAQIEMGLYGDTGVIDPVNCASVTVIGRYEDGQVAAVMKEVGKGRVIFLASEVADIYSRNTALAWEDLGRYELYQTIARSVGVRDHSWVWGVTLDNVKDLTGEAPSSRAEADPTVRFRSYMYRHGDRVAGPMNAGVVAD